MSAELLAACKPYLDIFLRDLSPQRVVEGVRLYKYALYIRYFKGYRVQTIGSKRLKSLVENEVFSNNDDNLAQLFIWLWNRAQDDLYHAVYNMVRSLDKNVEKIGRIGEEETARFLDELLAKFTPERIWLCTVLNEVRFAPKVVEEKLGRPVPESLAEKWEKNIAPEDEQKPKKDEAENEKQSAEREMSAEKQYEVETEKKTDRDKRKEPKTPDE